MEEQLAGWLRWVEQRRPRLDERRPLEAVEYEVVAALDDGSVEPLRFGILLAKLVVEGQRVERAIPAASLLLAPLLLDHALPSLDSEGRSCFAGEYCDPVDVEVVEEVVDRPQRHLGGDKLEHERLELVGCCSPIRKLEKLAEVDCMRV